MAQAVDVSSPAGPVTPDCPIFLLANDAIVAATPCLKWLPAPPAPGAGAAPRVQLSTAEAIRAFLTRCSISRIPANLQAARDTSILVARLHDAAWSRVLTELSASSVFPAGVIYGILAELDDAIRDATLANPANLELGAGDWRNAQAFAIPQGAGAAPQVARQALAPIRFLSLVTIDRLEATSSPQPLMPFAILAGALGPCLTQAERQSETSSVHLMATFISTHLSSATTDGARAIKTKDFVMGNRLPRLLLAHGAGEDELRAELEEGREYRADAAGRRSVESRRVLLLDDGYAAASSPAAPHARAERLNWRPHLCRTLAPGPGRAHA